MGLKSMKYEPNFPNFMGVAKEKHDQKHEFLFARILESGLNLVHPHSRNKSDK